LSKGISRRRALKDITATAILAPTVLGAARAWAAAALPTLPNLAASEALLLLPTDGDFAK
jgi:hypothetical protein